MLSIKRWIYTSIAPLYTIVVAVLVILFSGSPYEFMLGEVQDDGNKVTPHHLPVSIDAAYDVYIPITGALVFALLAVGILRSIRTRRVAPSFVFGCFLVLLWCYRFFWMTSG